MISLEEFKMTVLKTNTEYKNKLKTIYTNYGFSGDKLECAMRYSCGNDKPFFVDEDFARWASTHNMKWNDSNIFVDEDVTSLSNCCRLKSNIKDIGYFNSIGGSALKVGSVKVSTINLARIAYESAGNEKKYISILKDRLDIDMKVLHVIRGIIKRNVEKNLLPNFQDGIMDFEHLYNTIGINGVYETMKTFGYTSVNEFGDTIYSDDAMRFGKEIFEVIKTATREFAADKDYMVNCEQIPGETAALKFLEADKILFRNKTVMTKHTCNYNNYHFTINSTNYCVPENEKIMDDYTIKDILDNNYDIDLACIEKYIVKKC